MPICLGSKERKISKLSFVLLSKSVILSNQFKWWVITSLHTPLKLPISLRLLKIHKNHGLLSLIPLQEKRLITMKKVVTITTNVIVIGVIVMTKKSMQAIVINSEAIGLCNTKFSFQ